jgi:hypothetical protein
LLVEEGGVALILHLLAEWADQSVFGSVFVAGCLLVVVGCAV